MLEIELFLLQKQKIVPDYSRLSEKPAREPILG